MKRTRGGHNGGIEGAAAQVVDEDRGALRVEGPRVAVGVLEARSGGFVDHRENIPTSAAERLESEEALRRPRVRRNADEGFERLRIGQRCDGRVCAQLAHDVAEETGQRIEDRDAVIAQAQRRGVSHRRVGEQALERAQVGSALPGGVLGIKPIDQAVAVKSDDGRNEIDRIVIIVDEGNDRVVAPINDSDRSGCGAKINSESHSNHTSV